MASEGKSKGQGRKGERGIASQAEDLRRVGDTEERVKSQDHG